MGIAISQVEADKLDSVDTVRQDVGLGAKILELTTAAPIIVKFAITADATSGLTIPIPYDFELLEASVQCTTANAAGTATIRKTTTAITDAMIMAVDKVVVRAGTIDDAQSTILTTDSINVITNGADDRGIVTMIGKRS
jgi:hypothetical protein